MKTPALSALVLVCSLVSAHAATSSAAFNGSWDLVFVTRSGTCDPTYNFTVNISNGTRDAPEPREVQRLRAGLGVHSRVRHGAGQVRIWIWPVVWFFRQGHVEWPFRKCSMYGILDRPEKLDF